MKTSKLLEGGRLAEAFMCVCSQKKVLFSCVKSSETEKYLELSQFLAVAK